jgi:hypothetical protein
VRHIVGGARLKKARQGRAAGTAHKRTTQKRPMHGDKRAHLCMFRCTISKGHRKGRRHPRGPVCCFSATCSVARTFRASQDAIDSPGDRVTFAMATSSLKHLLNDDEDSNNVFMHQPNNGWDDNGFSYE